MLSLVPHVFLLSDDDSRLLLPEHDLSCNHCDLAFYVRRQYWNDIDGIHVEVRDVTLGMFSNFHLIFCSFLFYPVVYLY